jgi:hypothetical protein
LVQLRRGGLFHHHLHQLALGLSLLGTDGIVAKRKDDPYLSEHATWLKIRNTNYSQWANRDDLFERERSSDPDFQIWHGCALACETQV